MKRPVPIALAAVIVVVVCWQLFFGGQTKSGSVTVPVPVAAIGTGEEAVAVGPDGTVLDWLPPPDEESLPLLPAMEIPPSGRLAGTMLDQARVLGAAPAELRPYIASSYYGESGVNVELRAGIELRFGDASRAAQKWAAAAAVLADPSIEVRGYVDLRAPRHPATGGSGDTLPPVP